jgi:putative colanic acid biosynthesis acetyltransferase WcaF
MTNRALILLLWRALWTVASVRALRPLHRIRSLLVNAFGGTVFPGVRIYPLSQIRIPWHLSMAEGSTMGDSVICDNEHLVVIGARAIVSQRAKLLASRTLQNTDIKSGASATSGIGSFAIKIEPHSWIMAEAVIEGGVTVREGCVVAARSRVTETTEPWSVFAGDPAQRVRYRDRDLYLSSLTTSANARPDSLTHTRSQFRLTLRTEKSLHRVRRAIWVLLWYAASLIGTRRFWWLRNRLLRAFGGTIDSTARVDGEARIWAPWKLCVGAGARIEGNAEIYSVDRIEISTNAVIERDSFLCTASHDYNHPALPLITGAIYIGADSIVKEGAFVGPGVNIGCLAIIEARAVVIRDIDSGTRVRGNPARTF